jgi:BON domain-containing protein
VPRDPAPSRPDRKTGASRRPVSLIASRAGRADDGTMTTDDRPPEPGADALETLDLDALRIGETDDPTVATEEGLTWVPPVDPPTRTGEDGEPEFAAGFGMTAEDEPFDADHHAELLPQRDEMTDRVIEALRADAGTAELADQLLVDTEDGVVTVAGRVSDFADEDAIVAVASDVDGVERVESRLIIRGLDTGGASVG